MASEGNGGASFCEFAPPWVGNRRTLAISVMCFGTPVRAIASYRVRHNKRCKVLVSQMSATVYYRLSADASLDYRRNGRSQSSPPAFSSNEIPFPVSASCYSAKLNLDAIALALLSRVDHSCRSCCLIEKCYRKCGGLRHQSGAPSRRAGEPLRRHPLLASAGAAPFLCPGESSGTGTVRHLHPRPIF